MFQGPIWSELGMHISASPLDMVEAILSDILTGGMGYVGILTKITVENPIFKYVW
jgi:hypothetical protein